MEKSIILSLACITYLILGFMIIMITYIGYKTWSYIATVIPYLQTRRDRVYVSMIVITVLGLMAYGLYRATVLVIKISSIIMEG